MGQPSSESTAPTQSAASTPNDVRHPRAVPSEVDSGTPMINPAVAPPVAIASARPTWAPSDCGTCGDRYVRATGLERRRVQAEVRHRSRALPVVPAVGQQDSANIEKDHVEGEHRRLSVSVSAMNL